MLNYRSELKSLQEAYNALKKEVTDYKTALKEEKQKFRRLRRAIPSLPDPEQLYSNIVARCRDFHDCVTRMSTLNLRIRSLRSSTADWSTRFHEREVIEVTVDRMRTEFLFVRCQIRTFFSLPPLLIADGTISEAVWRTWMEKEQVNDEDEPLVMEPHIIEAAIADQLQLLDGHRRAISDLRYALQEEYNKTTASFQKTTTQALHHLQSSVDALSQQSRNDAEVLRHLQSSLEELAIQIAHPPILERESSAEDVRERDPSAEDEASDRDAHEEEIIRENAQFMEEVQDVEAEREEQRDLQQPENQDNISRRRSIEQEIQRLRQEELNLDQIIENLQAQETCPPRRFEHGEIRAEEDRFMRCAFCNLMGVHYSDSCNVVMTVGQRRRLVEEKRLCTMCLEHCTGGQYCKKRNTRCYHCRRRGHHSAICDLPETTVEILQQFTTANQERLRCRRRIEELERDLQRLR